MIPEDRLKKILQLIEQNHSISVSELTSLLYVSPATIRRDLAELSKRGLIMRSFGGALSVSTKAHSQPLQPQPERMPIGECAAQLVEDQNAIFLDSSALTLSMTPELARRGGLTVVTNSVRIADALCGQVSHLYCTGGKYLPAQNEFSDRQATAFAECFQFDLCFISCDGLTHDGRLSYFGLERMLLLQTLVRNARKRVLLCPADLIGKTANHTLLTLGSIDIIITDAPGKIPLDYAGTVLGTEHSSQDEKTKKEKG